MDNLADRFNELDYMTQRTIQYEFPSIFPECQISPIDTRNIEHFQGFTFDSVPTWVLWVAFIAPVAYELIKSLM